MMKENIYNLSLWAMIASALLSLSMSGCSDSDDAVTDTREPNLPDIIQPLTLSSVASGASDLTRGAVSELEHSATIGFYVKAPDFNADGADAYTEYGNVAGRYQADKDRWLPDSDIFLSNRNAKMTVYSPYDKNQSKDSLLLTAALAAADGSNDILAKTMDVNSLLVVSGLNVTLSHLYTCLQFTFVKNEDFASSEVVIERLELTGDDIYAEGNYDPYAGTYGPSLKGKSDVSLKISDLLVPLASEVAGGTAAAVLRTLLIPVNHVFKEDAYLWITLKQTSTTPAKRIGVRIPKNTFSAAQPFAPNKQYNFTIKVSPYQQMEIIDVQVEAWPANPDSAGNFFPSFD